MALAVGTRLGSYEILGPLGEGGMGIVYRARDTKLEREVAVKVLPDEYAFDVERLSRFEREAKLLASLNHPNIAALYRLEAHGEQPVQARPRTGATHLYGPSGDRMLLFVTRFWNELVK